MLQTHSEEKCVRVGQMSPHRAFILEKGGGVRMLTIEDIKENREIMDCLNLEMTPEKAVALYLEWGSSWAHGRDFVRSQSDVSCYFTLDTWEEPAKILLRRQSMAEGETIGELEVPSEILEREVRTWGGKRGTYGISEDLKDWIRSRLS
jgi:hypothetical protein